MKRLDTKIAVVTGAGSDWGKELAATFSREGAYVIPVDENVADAFQQVEVDHGRLDVLVNALESTAGADVVATSEDEWELAMTVNVTSAFLAMKQAVPLMTRYGGSIVNISSVGSIRYDGPAAGPAAAKAALNHLTRVTAAEYAFQQIRVNAVLPDRHATPTDVAQAALFLAGDASRFITGTELVIDGGRGDIGGRVAELVAVVGARGGADAAGHGGVFRDQQGMAGV
jgi:NAD(P)-dependent dehydrogenase (short-subunit alcohol dehydrogenase family)